MLQLDPDDVDDDENNKVLNALNITSNISALTTTTMGITSVLTDADQVTLTNYKV